MSNPVWDRAIQICFCGENCQALPVEPLDTHKSFCLSWDFAMAHGKITPSQFLAKLGDAATELGLTVEEIEAEAASSPAPFLKGLPW